MLLGVRGFNILHHSSGSNSPKTSSWIGCQESPGNTVPHPRTEESLATPLQETSNHAKICHIKNKDKQTFQMKHCRSIKKKECHDLSVPGENVLQLRRKFLTALTHNFTFTRYEPSRVYAIVADGWSAIQISYQKYICERIWLVGCLLLTIVNVFNKLLDKKENSSQSPSTSNSSFIHTCARVYMHQKTFLASSVIFNTHTIFTVVKTEWGEKN